MENISNEKYKEFTQILKDSYAYYLELCEKYNRPVGCTIWTNEEMEKEFNTFLYKKVCRGDNQIVFKKSIGDDENKIYRGLANLSSYDYFKILKAKNSNIYRKGSYGDGMYFSAEVSCAKNYVENNGALITAAFADDCKFVNWTAIDDQRDTFIHEYVNSGEYANFTPEEKTFVEKSFFNNDIPTFYAGFFGYDALRFGHVYCVFNLDKIVIEDKNMVEEKVEEKPKKNFFSMVFGK
ncbi:MAG: hypothetical protein IJ008_02375 [Clostridia bacterium]|nr:hypothetical protein [Clostridia bacterium]